MLRGVSDTLTRAGPRIIAVLIQPNQEMGSPGTLIGEHAAVFETLNGWTVGEMFVYPDEPVNGVFEPETKWVLTVIAIENAGITFRRKDVGIGK